MLGDGGSSIPPETDTGVGSSSIMSPDGGGSGGGDFYEGDRSSGGNRWPRQETLALLKIRSDMDGVFRDSSLKGPLWEEVSRKMAELGYHRSSKKCKEKFENVYKYHKRTKDGRVGKSDGKTYRFFDQLEAFEQHHSSPSQLPPLPPTTPRPQPQSSSVHAPVPVTMVFPAGMSSPAGGVTTIPSNPHQQQQINFTTTSIPETRGTVSPNYHQQYQQQMENVSSPSATQSSSSSTSSDEEVLGRRKRKRKWKDFFGRLLKEVMEKQEVLQARFLEAVERREHDRLVREEAWKAQEMGRLNREHEILVQERSMAAAKDAALIDLLKKLSDRHQIPMPFPVHIHPQHELQSQPRNVVPVVTSTVVTTVSPLPSPPPPVPKPISEVVQAPLVTAQFHVQETPISLPVPVPVPIQGPAQTQAIPQPKPLTQIQPQPVQQRVMVLANANVDTHHESNNGGENQQQPSSSRWPKPEVEALINLRTKMDEKYQENCPKGPLWEEISSSMKQLGYNRNAKRCKEKWENINKYFKKVKESNKKRPEDSKTCPYFPQLDALYRNKTATTYAAPPLQQAAVKPENLNTMGPIMAQPHQRWRHPHDPHHRVVDAGSGNETDDDEEDDDDDQGNGYEIVANNGNNSGICSMGTSTATAAATTAATTAE